MDLKRVSPTEAKRLMDEEGYTLVDVRSQTEYAAGHPAAALNIPYLLKTPGGMVPNQAFVQVLRAAFPDPSAKLITSCQIGARSARAAVELLSLGYLTVVDMIGGFGGERDDEQGTIHPGWKDLGLPTEAGEPDGRSYASIEQAASRPAQDSGHEERPSAEDDLEASAERAHRHAPSHGHGHGARPSNAASSERAPQGGAGLGYGQGAVGSALEGGMNRFASAKRRVLCAKFGRELPGLKRRPFPGPVGERVFNEISAMAWDVWVEHQKMLVNEYKIRSDDAAAMKLLIDQCEKFLFGEGSRLPEGYIPEGTVPSGESSST